MFDPRSVSVIQTLALSPQSMMTFTYAGGRGGLSIMFHIGSGSPPAHLFLITVIVAGDRSLRRSQSRAANRVGGARSTAVN